MEQLLGNRKIYLAFGLLFSFVIVGVSNIGKEGFFEEKNFPDSEGFTSSGKFKSLEFFPSLSYKSGLQGYESSSVISGTEKLIPDKSIANDSFLMSDENKIRHIFGNPGHDLDSFLKKFGGNKEKAFDKLREVAQNYVDANGITGMFNQEFQIEGEIVIIR